MQESRRRNEVRNIAMDIASTVHLGRVPIQHNRLLVSLKLHLLAQPARCSQRDAEVSFIYSTQAEIQCVPPVLGLIEWLLSVSLERMIAEYEEEIWRSREENERQRQLLDALLKHQDEKHRAGLFISFSHSCFNFQTFWVQGFLTRDFALPHSEKKRPPNNHNANYRTTDF